MIYPFHEKTIMVHTAQGHYVGKLRFFFGPKHSRDDLRSFIGRAVGVASSDMSIRPSALSEFFSTCKVSAIVRGL
jgi:hypothetical protein